MLTLRDRQFVLTGGVISATLEDPHWVARYDGPREPRLFWSISFDTVGREFDDELWEPSLRVEAPKCFRVVTKTALVWRGVGSCPSVRHDPVVAFRAVVGCERLNRSAASNAAFCDLPWASLDQ